MYGEPADSPSGRRFWETIGVMEVCGRNGSAHGFPACFIRLSAMRSLGRGAAARTSLSAPKIRETAAPHIAAARWRAVTWNRNMPVVVLAALWAGMAPAKAACGAQRYMEPPPFVGAYVATAPNVRGGTVEYLYDHGKYTIRKSYEVRLYDGSNQAVRWWLDPLRRTARIDRVAAMQRLYREIAAHGVDSVSRSTGLDRAGLLRFQTAFPQRVERNLDSLLYSPSKAEMARYDRTGAENVCGLRCIVYTSKQSPGNRMWVEPSTGFVFRRHYTEVPDNPRIAPQVRDYQLTSFRRAAAIDPSRFSLPPGTTAELPRLLADMPLPPGVNRKILTGRDAELGFSLR